MSTAADHVAFLDRYYGVQGHFYNITRRIYLFGRERMLRRIRESQPASVLEMGCGTARNLLRLASWLPLADLCGVDASKAMLGATRPHKRVRLVLSCAEEIAGPQALGRPAGFDAVFFSYSLSMMPAWEGALEAAQRCLAPGGAIHIVDFWDFGRWPQWARAWLNRRLHQHRVHFEPRVHQWLTRGAGGVEIKPVAGRWAYLAHYRPPLCPR